MDHDVIACLYPHGLGVAGGNALEAIKASSRYLPPQLALPSHTRPSRRGRRERESTEPPENPGASALDYLPCLVVKLSDVPRTDKGLVFGSNPNCDVVLRAKGVSNIHFSLAFDGSNRPLIKDLHSSMGTQVTYDGEGEGVRRDFRWIVGGHDIPQQKKSVVITIPYAVSFQIVVPPHDTQSPMYNDMVSRFKRGTATAEGLLYDLSLSNPSTTLGTGANTPGTEEIHLSKKLGEGSFGVVTHLWNVSTGEERVVKAPTMKAIQKKQFDEEIWRREARIMKRVSHEHIVRLIGSSFIPYPQLDLEYVPCGALGGHVDISYDETLTILEQCLSALAYIHGLEPPIAHRDIKPDNILVEYRHDGYISVKLGDFGLSRDKVELTTICGTQTYLAPEIYSELQQYDEDRLGYTRAVDIWSLGVVACELAYGLPRYKDRYRTNGGAWCMKIATELQKALQIRPSDLGQFLLTTMVVLDPGDRFCADDCYDLVRHLGTAETSYLHASPLALYSEEEDQATFRYALQNHDTEALPTVVYQPRSTGAATLSSFVKSGAPPPASLPSSWVVQECEECEEPTSSAIMRFADRQQGHELTQFFEGYPANSLNSIYVGQSLASQLGGNNSEDWASQFLQESSQYNQARASGLQTEVTPGPLRSSIPRGEGGGWPLQRGTFTGEEGNAIGADDYEEIAGAALLLQAIGQGSGAL